MLLLGKGSLRLNKISDLLALLLLREGFAQYEHYFQQFKGNSYNAPQSNYFQQYYTNDYSWDKYKRIEKPKRRYSKNEWQKHYEYSESSEIEYPDEIRCKCSCDQCEDLEPCCVQVCVNCNLGPGLVVVPYAVPLIIHLSTTQTDTTMTATDTSIVTTTVTTTAITRSTAPIVKSTTPYIKVSNEKLTYPKSPSHGMWTCPLENNCIRAKSTRIYRRNDLNIYDEQPKRFHHNNGVIRPTLPNWNIVTRRPDSSWMPKFGIVSIPNDIAVKLMEEVKEEKSFYSN